MSQVPLWFERKFEFSFPVELLPGTQVGGQFFCCAHCARLATSADLRDQAA